MKSLDCLLINPPYVFPNGFYSGQRALDPPLGLMALAGYVRSAGQTVRILDCNVEFSDTEKELEAYLSENLKAVGLSPRVVGLTTTTPTIYAAFRIARTVKRLFPDALVVFGGAHAAYVPDESLSKAFVDVVCIGEGEDTLLEILESVPLEQIRGIAYKLHGSDGAIELRRNTSRERIRALDSLPLPAYDLLNMGVYRPIIGNFKRLPAMMMISSRGCPWSCNFCRRPVGKMWTYRSAESLYGEMKMLSERYGIRDITFMDDVFTVNRQRVFDLCRLLVENPLDVKWKCFARVDIVSPELLVAMKGAGCWGIMFGVENFDQTILNEVNKEVELNQIFDAIHWSKVAGLDIRLCMMVGNMADTKAGLDRNIALLKKLEPDTLSVAILTPFPGHDIYNELLPTGRITTFDWDLYFGSTPIVRIDHMTQEEVYSYFRKMTFDFYFRPSYILRRLLKMRNLKELKYYAIGFFGLFGFYLEQMKRQFVTREIKPQNSACDDLEIKNVRPETVIRLTSEPSLQTLNT